MNLFNSAWDEALAFEEIRDSIWTSTNFDLFRREITLQKIPNSWTSCFLMFGKTKFGNTSRGKCRIVYEVLFQTPQAPQNAIYAKICFELVLFIWILPDYLHNAKHGNTHKIATHANKHDGRCLISGADKMQKFEFGEGWSPPKAGRRPPKAGGQ